MKAVVALALPTPDASATTLTALGELPCSSGEHSSNAVGQFDQVYFEQMMSMFQNSDDILRTAEYGGPEFVEGSSGYAD